MSTAIDRLSDLNLFARIVQNGSLSAAARDLDLSLATVSARLANLERSLGVTLLNRSTRSMSLTEQGQQFLLRAQKILSDVSELEHLLSDRPGEPRGRLRITATTGFTRRHIAPRIAKFHALYPEIVLDLVVTDQVVDIIQEGIDIAIRQIPLPDSSLRVRVIAANHRIACASPAYVDRCGRPTTPDDLATHECIVIGDPPMTRWSFTQKSGGQSLRDVAVDVPYVCQTNDDDVAHGAAVNGAGIALKSIIDVADDIAAGRLIDLFPEWRSPCAPIQVVYPPHRHPSDKVNVFIDFLSGELMAHG